METSLLCRRIKSLREAIDRCVYLGNYEMANIWRKHEVALVDLLNTKIDQLNAVKG